MAGPKSTQTCLLFLIVMHHNILMSYCSCYPLLSVLDFRVGKILYCPLSWSMMELHEKINQLTIYHNNNIIASCMDTDSTLCQPCGMWDSASHIPHSAYSSLAGLCDVGCGLQNQTKLPISASIDLSNAWVHYILYVICSEKRDLPEIFYEYWDISIDRYSSVYADYYNGASFYWSEAKIWPLLYAQISMDSLFFESIIA